MAQKDAADAQGQADAVKGVILPEHANGAAGADNRDTLNPKT